MGRKAAIDETGLALAAMADASFSGDVAVKAATAASFAALAGSASARVLERAGENWTVPTIAPTWPRRWRDC